MEQAADAAVERCYTGWTAADRLARGLDALPVAVVIHDRSGEIVLCNQAAVPYLDVHGPYALAKRCISELLGAALAGETRSELLELYGPPRQTLKITVKALDDGRGDVCALTVIEDVSDRERLIAGRRDLVANISHELKTPVAALALLAETMAMEDDHEVVARLAQRLQSEARRLGRLVEELLDLNRIESEQTPRREAVAVPQVVSDALDRVRPVAEHRGVHVDIDEVPPGLTVLGDLPQLVSAVYNLAENAVKYSEAGSRVRVVVRTEGRSVEIGVHDRGIGIPAQDLERIFERFYRVDHARARDTGGTGLGLAIVRHIAANHGGEVLVESCEGEGSSFTLRLPRPATVATAAAKAGMTA